MKRGLASVLLGVHVGSLLDQGLRDLQVSIPSAIVKRGIAIIVRLGIQVSTRLNQGSRDLQVSIRSALVKRGIAIIVRLGIQVSSRLNQISRDLQVSISVSIHSALVKRGPAVVVFGVHVSSRLDQGSSDLQVSIRSALVKRGLASVLAIFFLGVHVSAFFESSLKKFDIHRVHSSPQFRIGRQGSQGIFTNSTTHLRERCSIRPIQSSDDVAHHVGREFVDYCTSFHGFVHALLHLEKLNFAFRSPSSRK